MLDPFIRSTAIRVAGKESTNPPPCCQPVPSIHRLVLVLYIVLTGLMTWPLLRNLTTAIPGDGFDGWQNYWNLWWMKVALVERAQTPLFSDVLYYPTGVGLYFHTLNPFNGLVTLPIQLSGGLVLAYNSVVWISWVLGGYGVFLLTLWALRKRLAVAAPGPRFPIPYLSAFLAGIIFTFSPFHMAHLLGHMQVMSLQWMPFYVLYLLRGASRARQGAAWRRDGIMAGLFLALVGLCDWYFVLYLFLFTVLFLLWQAIIAVREPGTSRPRTVLTSLMGGFAPALTAGITFLVLLSPILVPMVGEAIRFDFMERPASDLYILSATVADFLIPNRLHSLFRPHSFSWIGNEIAPVSERTIAIGYVALILGLAGGLLDRRRAAFWLATAAIFLLISLGPAFNLLTVDWDDVPAGNPGLAWTPYDLLNRTIPFMRISRSVSRFAVVVQLALAVAAAIGLTALLRRIPRKATYTFFALITIGVLFEYWVAPYPLSSPDTPDFYTQLRENNADGSVLNLPMNYDRPGYLLYQTVHRKPLAVAYISRDDPRTYTERIPVLQHFRHLGPDIIDLDPAEVGQTILHDLGVGWVILDRYKMPDGLERAYTTELAQAIFSGQIPLYEDDRITVYDVHNTQDREPYLLLGPTGWGPLQIDGTGEQGRRISAEPASLQLRHVPVDGLLTIQYRTLSATVPVEVLSPTSEQPLVTLPPAPAGNTVTLDLAALGSAANGRQEPIEELLLTTADPQGAVVTTLTLRTL